MLRLVNTNDTVIRDGQRYEVVIADDNIFVICPIFYDEKEKSDIVRFDKAEIYANQDSINTLEELRFEKISSNSVQEITSKYSEREKRIDEGYDEIVRTDLIKSILSINFIEDQEKRVCWRATYKDRSYGDGINVSKENVLEAITLLHKQAVRCLCTVESEEQESINELSNGLAKADELANGLTSDLANDNEIIRGLERMSEEDPDGFSSDLLNLINSLKAEIDNLNSELTLLKNDNKHLKGLYEDEKAKVEKAKGKVIDICKRLKTTKSEAVREFAKKIDQLFDRYAHMLSHADCARKDYIKTDDGTEIEMQSVWDVFRLEKHGIAEYEEMNRLQENIELIEKGRLLAELKKDFRLLVKEMMEGNNAE